MMGFNKSTKAASDCFTPTIIILCLVWGTPNNSDFTMKSAELLGLTIDFKTYPAA